MTDWIPIFDFIPEKYHKNHGTFDMSIFADPIEIKNSFSVQKLGNEKVEKIRQILTDVAFSWARLITFLQFRQH